MPDKRAHRGPHPSDHKLFAEEYWPALRAGVHDLSWLLSYGYAQKSALKLVGDRHRLTERQRMAVLRSACSDRSLMLRASRLAEPELLQGRPVAVDGYNLLTTIEAALAGGVLLIGRDGCVRDLASVHGSFRKVEETLPALNAIADWTVARRTGPWTWYLDQPVSNSGRLKVLLYEFAESRGLNWTVELVYSPDAILKKSDAVVVTTDSQILDESPSWTNAARDIIHRHVAGAWIVDLNF